MKSLIIFFSLLIYTTSYAVELVNEQFSSNINGWSVSNSSKVYYSPSYSGSMFIDRKDKGWKTYSFGSSYASQTLDIEVAWCATNQWENNNDYLRVKINGSTEESDYDGGGCQSTSFSADADSDGDFKIEFSPRTSSNNEDAYIEWFTVNGTPTVQTPPTFAGTIPNQTKTQGASFSLDTSTYFSETESDTITYSSSGALPAGISLDPNSGVLNGTPTDVNNYINITITATDDDGSVSSNSFNIIESQIPPTFTGTIPDQTTSINASFTLNISSYFTETNGDSITYSDSSNLPAGITLDTATGILSGTPTATGTYSNIIITVTDDDGSVNSNTFTITSNCDASLDASDAADSAPGTIITSLNNISTSLTTCISGSSPNGDADYYHFSVATDGTLDITTSSPNSHNYHLKIGSSSGGDEYYTNTTAQSHSVSQITLASGDSVYIYVKETGSNTDEYQLNFDFQASTPSLEKPDLNQCGMFMSVLTTYTHISIAKNDIKNSCNVAYPLGEYTANHTNPPTCYADNSGTICPNSGECVRVDPPTQSYNHTFINTSDTSTNTTSGSQTFNAVEYGSYSMGGNNGTVITFDPQTSYSNDTRKVMLLGDFVFTGNSQKLIFKEGDYYFKSLNLAGNMVEMDIQGKVNIFIEGNFDYAGNSASVADAGSSLFVYVGGDATFSGFGGGNSWLGMFIYIKGNTTIDANSNAANLYGGITTEGTLDITGNNMNFIYNEDGANNLNDDICPYCQVNGLNEGFNLVDPDAGSDTNSFELFCHEDTNGWHDLIALPIKNNSNNFLFNNNSTSSNYYDTVANPRAHFHAIEINANDITYTGTLDDGVTPRPIIPVVVSADAEPYSITTDSNSYNVMGSSFSNINLTGTPFKIDWAATGTLGGCDESKLRKALGQAVKYNTINMTTTSNDSLSRCKISTMKLSLLDDYQYLTYGGSEVLQHSCKEMATYVPSNVLTDSSVDGHFNILTTEPAYVNSTPTTNGTRDNNLDIGATLRPLTVYCKYQTDLSYVWTFLTALDAKVTQSKSDLVSGSDTCSQLGLFFYVPNTKTTFNRVREYLLDKKTGDDGWENYTGTINEKIQALHSGNNYYLSAFRDVVIWPYGPLGVYFPTDGWQSGTNSWWSGNQSIKAWMSGSPMHNITSIANYNDSMGAKGFVSILGSQDLNKTNDWWIADIGAGEEIGLATPQYAPHGTHPIQSANYKYYEPNGNYTANSWLNFIFDSQGWIYHLDDWNDNYPYYDYMCMSETNYDTASRYTLVPGFFNAIERSRNTGGSFSDENLSTQIVSKPIQFDILLYSLDGSTLGYDKTQLEQDQNKSVGVFVAKAQSDGTFALVQYIGEFEDFEGNNGRIEISDFTINTAIGGYDSSQIDNSKEEAMIKFYYCDSTNSNWRECWSYNDNPSLPTVTESNTNDTGMVDSTDYFAVRPKAFSITSATGSTTVKAQDVDINYYAYNYLNAATNGYNELLSSLDINTSLADATKLANCQNLDLTLTLPSQFVNGINNGITTLANIGVYNIAISEINGSEFAIIDADDTDDINRLITPSDINLTIVPDHFATTPITQINIGSNFTYLANNLENMGLKFDFNVTAQNSANATTKNYSSACYANNINVDMIYGVSNGTMADTIIYTELNSAIDGNNTATNNLITLPKVAGDTLPASLFTTDNNGTAELSIRVNFQRDNNNSLNPFTVNFSDLNVSDQSGAIEVSNDNSHIINNDGNMIYGRTHAPRYRFSTLSGNVMLYYESFCNGAGCGKNLLPNGSSSKSTDDPRWFINTFHTSTSGVAGSINQKGFSVGVGDVTGTTATTATPSQSTLTYNASATKGYPYKTTMENNASSWLIYNKYNANATKNEFEVEFEGSGSTWIGVKDTNTTTQRSGANRTNRRSMW